MNNEVLKKNVEQGSFSGSPDGKHKQLLCFSSNKIVNIFT